MATHSEQTGVNLHVPGYQQSADPGEVGAGIYWVDTSGGAGSWVLKVRNEANDGWETVGAGGGGGSNPIYPERADMSHEQSIVIAGNALAWTYSDPQIYSYYLSQSPAALNDEFENSFVIRAGTYTLYVLGQTVSNRGIVTWSVDGVEVGSQDWFGGSAFNVVKTVTGIVIAASGRHVLTGKVAGKNAGSSDYLMTLTKMWLLPAAYTEET